MDHCQHMPKLTLWHTVLLEKLTVSQLLKLLLSLYETLSLLPRAKYPITGPQPEQDQFSLHRPAVFTSIHLAQNEGLLRDLANTVLNIRVL
jgi:hypothetical protein